MLHKLKPQFKNGRYLFLAPMEGISNHAYRNLAVKHNPMDVVCTEFVRLSGSAFRPSQIRDEIKLFESATLSVQLMGENPLLFANTIAYFIDLGVKIIDLNLGCPSAKVNSKGCGAAMLLNTDLLKTVLKAIRNSCPVLFSCKMRAGWDNPNKAVEIAKIIESEGVDFLTVHPRTRMQGYEGNANWEIIKAIKTELKIPVIGNGDIKTIFDAKRIIDQTNCDGIMIGRGQISDPFLLKKIHYYFDSGKELELNNQQYLNFYQEFYQSMIDDKYSNIAILSKFKEHFRYFTNRLDNSEKHWDFLKRTTDMDIFLDYIEKILI